MTKKSSARRARDAKAAKTLATKIATGQATPGMVTRMSPAKRMQARSQFNRRVNTCWDDTNMSMEMVRKALGYCARSVQEIISDKSIMPYMDNVAEYTSRVSSVTNDVNQLVADFELAQQGHAGKTGGSDNPDDVMASIQINELYRVILEKIQSVVYPMLSTISASAGVARTRQAYTVKGALEAKQAEGELSQEDAEQLAVLTEITTGLEEYSNTMESARTAAQSESEESVAADPVLEEAVPAEQSAAEVISTEEAQDEEPLEAAPQ